MLSRQTYDKALRRLAHPAVQAAKLADAESWPGVCPICEKPVRFFAKHSWYRDWLLCGSCGSVPRERALMSVLKMLYPEWRGLSIHESSPSGRGASVMLRRECPSYLASQYDLAIPFGGMHSTGWYRSEDLEQQTLPDEAFDIVVTQDVFEHLFHPDRAIQEIARTLRPGGAHIMTVPIVNKSDPSHRRASIADGQVVHRMEAQYHGNPMSADGSLVTVDWGYDIADYLAHHSGLSTVLFHLDDLSQGIRAEYIEVVVSRKGSVPLLA